MKAPVAITGAGAVTPLGADAALWTRPAAAAPGSGGAVDIPLADLPEAVAGRAARAERVSQLALVAGGAALAASGLDVTDGPPRAGIGVVLGTAFGCFLTNAAYQRRLAAGGTAAASPRLFAATVSNAAAGELAIAYRLGGPAVTLTAGAAAGLLALGHATDLLRAGRADALVAGGMDALGEAVRRWLADGGLDIGRAPAEAAAAVVLEPLATAARRGVRVRGVVAGSASGFEPEPAAGVGAGLRAAVTAAITEAGLEPGAIGIVVSAAPPALVALEERVIAGVLGSRRPPRMAPKDVLGETFGAAGPLGLLAALAAVPRGAAALVLDVCASGHVAALVARRAEDG